MTDQLDVVVHDSCVFARYEDVVDAPRQLLNGAGVTVREPVLAGKLTWCCGGPAESLYPAKAAKVAAKRVEQLSAVAPDCVTMCPICLVNLRNSADGTLRIGRCRALARHGRRTPSSRVVRTCDR